MVHGMGTVYLWMLYALQVVSARAQKPGDCHAKLWAWIFSYLCEIQEQSGDSELDVIGWSASVVSLSVRWSVSRLHRLVTSSLRTADSVIFFASLACFFREKQTKKSPACVASAYECT